MSKDAKLLFISLGIFAVTILIIIMNSKFYCYDVEYQNLDGVHTKRVCEQRY